MIDGSQTIMQYILNLDSAICQLYFNKTEKNPKEKNAKKEGQCSVNACNKRILLCLGLRKDSLREENLS